MMNSAGVPHLNGQFCYLCGCSQGCCHMAWPYDVACYGSHACIIISRLQNWLICLMEHKSPELLKICPTLYAGTTYCACFVSH